jgi:alcohol dehydrogenase (cytochrome c)
MIRRRRATGIACLLLGGSVVGAQAQVTAERLANAAREPANWLSYSGEFSGQRYSALDQITPANIKALKLKWVYQAAQQGGWQSSPLVVDGIMYLTQRPNDVVALDARTGRVFWIYHHKLDPIQIVCCGANNRGLAMLGSTLFMGTLDARLVAVDARSGKPLWITKVADNHASYSITLAPLVVKDKVVIGVGGGEYGIRGFVAAYDVKTGKETWRTYTIPAPGEPGAETWQKCPAQPEVYCDADSWQHGGGPVWVTGSYDPELNLTYWGAGNPGPDFNELQRPGDNLYTDSVLALDADTGQIRWHYQFTPRDTHDYDATQVPVLADIRWQGQPVKAMLWANRNGVFYVLNRATGQFLLGKPFVKVTWMHGFDRQGHPILTPQPIGQPNWPGDHGGTNWYSPSYSPRTGLFYVSAWENNFSLNVAPVPFDYKPGRGFEGGTPPPQGVVPGAPRLAGLGARAPINEWTEVAGTGAVIAIDPLTGEKKWRFPMTDVTESGILTTGSDLLFAGGREGFFQVLDARSGSLLWKINLGAGIMNGPITYEVDGKQYVAVIAGLSLSVFGVE